MATPASFSIIPNRRDFLAAAAGKKFVTNTLILQMVERTSDHPAEPGARLGFTVTKRVGNAVARNRIRRRLREVARKIAPFHVMERHDYVVIARQRALGCDFSELLRDMEFAFSRITAKKGVPKQG